MTKINPRNLVPGQRVRVSFDAAVEQGRFSEELYVHVVGGRSGLIAFAGLDFDALTCELLPDPIAVGDRVLLSAENRGTVLAIADEFAWVKWDEGRASYPTSARLDNLTKVEAAQ